MDDGLLPLWVKEAETRWSVIRPGGVAPSVVETDENALLGVRFVSFPGMPVAVLLACMAHTARGASDGRVISLDPMVIRFREEGAAKHFRRERISRRTLRL